MKRIIDEQLADTSGGGAAAGQEPLSRGSLAADAEPRRAVRVGGPRRGHILWRPRRQQQLVRRLGSAQAIDERLQLFKVHLPYHESDHVLNLAYNARLCVEDLELRRQDEAYLDLTGCRRIPDPTTAGDFLPPLHRAPTCAARGLRRARQVWSEQPPEFFAEAADRSRWNPGGNRGRGARRGPQLSRPVGLSSAGCCAGQHGRGAAAGQSGRQPPQPGRRGGAVRPVPRAAPRGGLPADLAPQRHRLLCRPRTSIVGMPRGRAVRVRPGRHRRAARGGRRLAGHGLETLEKAGENPGFRPIAGPARAGSGRPSSSRGFKDPAWSTSEVTERPYRPTACRTTYRLVIVRKNLQVSEPRRARCSRTIATSSISPTTGRARQEQIVFSANQRCQQENVLAQLKEGAPQVPVDNLLSNEAYSGDDFAGLEPQSVAGALLPEPPATRARPEAQARPAAKQRLLGLEFRSFVNSWMRLPALVVKTGGIVVRLLAWNARLPEFFRLAGWLRPPCARVSAAVLKASFRAVVRPTPPEHNPRARDGARPRNQAVTQPRREPRLRPTTPTNRTPPPPAADQPRCANPSPNNDERNTLG